MPLSATIPLPPKHAAWRPTHFVDFAITLLNFLVLPDAIDDPRISPRGPVETRVPPPKYNESTLFQTGSVEAYKLRQIHDSYSAPTRLLSFLVLPDAIDAARIP